MEPLRPPLTLYISGPMTSTGRADFNFPAFHEAAADLRRRGFTVLNPAENFGGNTELPRKTYMREDIGLVLKCEAVVVLPDWRSSAGALLEAAIARELSLPVVDYQTLTPVSEKPVDIAKDIVYGPRRADYGHPFDDYDRTAKIWSAIIGHPVTAEQAVMCMIGVKLSRECNRPKHDNRIDMAGYAECLDLVAQERAIRK